MRKTFGEVWEDILKLCNTKNTIHTLTQRKWNKITRTDSDSISVLTKRSEGIAKKVPKWMFEEAWRHLIANGSLSQMYLVRELNVRRSAFVMSALAHLPYIEYSKKPTIIYLCKMLTHPLGETKLRAMNRGEALIKAKKSLTERGGELFNRPSAPVQFTGQPQADRLLNDLDNYPHAFVLACIMDRQIKAERAWLIPYEMKKRIGSFRFSKLKNLSLSTIKRHMVKPEPLHRFNEVMSRYFYFGIQKIKTDYNGNAQKIWSDNPSSATIVSRFLEFDGVGQKIGTMAANILVRDFKIPVSDKVSIDISVDVLVRRVLERLGMVRKKAKPEEIVYFARSVNPEYPGIIDLPAWEIGRNWCKSRKPLCNECYMNECCPSAFYLQ